MVYDNKDKNKNDTNNTTENMKRKNSNNINDINNTVFYLFVPPSNYTHSLKKNFEFQKNRLIMPTKKNFGFFKIIFKNNWKSFQNLASNCALPSKIIFGF